MARKWTTTRTAVKGGGVERERERDTCFLYSQGIRFSLLVVTIRFHYRKHSKDRGVLFKEINRMYRYLLGYRFANLLSTCLRSHYPYLFLFPLRRALDDDAVRGISFRYWDTLLQ